MTENTARDILPLLSILDNDEDEATITVAELAQRFPFPNDVMCAYDGSDNHADHDSYHMGYGGMLGGIKQPWGWDYEPTHIRIPDTEWGDYSGSTVARSNWRSILRDYPQYVKDVSGGCGSHYLVMALDQEIPEAFADSLVNMVCDYPIWDESDHSELEQEIMQETFENSLFSDLKCEITDRIEDLDDMFTDSMVEFFESMGDDVLKEQWWELWSESDSYPVYEDADSCYFPDWKIIAKAMAEDVATAWHKSWNEYADQLTAAMFTDMAPLI